MSLWRHYFWVWQNPRSLDHTVCVLWISKQIYVNKFFMYITLFPLVFLKSLFRYNFYFLSPLYSPFVCACFIFPICLMFLFGPLFHRVRNNPSSPSTEISTAVHSLIGFRFLSLPVRLYVSHFVWPWCLPLHFRLQLKREDPGRTSFSRLTELWSYYYPIVSMEKSPSTTQVGSEISSWFSSSVWCTGCILYNISAA